MEKWHTRLQDALDRKGWTAARLAEESGVPVANVYKYLDGVVAAPRGDTLPKLAAALGTNLQWLMLGVNTEPQASVSASLLPLDRLQVVDLERIPTIVGRTGKLMLDKEQSEHIDVPKQFGPRALGVRVVDDSMAPKIPAGAIVVCDPDAEPEPGRYVVAMNTKTKIAVVRRYRKPESDRALVELVPENPDYPRMKLTLGKDGFIVGRVVWIMIPA